MEKFQAYRSPSRLTTWLGIMISFTFIIAWLPFVRALFDGSSYQWGINYFGLDLGGAGITPDYIFLLLQAAFYLTLFTSMYRVSNRLVSNVLLVLWLVHSFGNFIFYLIVFEDIEFHGDTMGIHISLSQIMIPLGIMALLLVVFEIIADRRRERKMIAWSAKNKTMLWIFVASLPIQGGLLAYGVPYGLMDKFGVLVGIIQCFWIPMILRPYRSKIAK